jgi:geranylgeranyl reductase family protein
MKRIAIIGAGPAGLYAAYLLARQGHNVTVFEEHDTIGIPIQCTGVVTEDILRFLPELKKSGSINNIIKAIAVHSKKRSFKVKTEEYILDRSRFDQYIGRLAAMSGAVIRPRHAFMDIEKGRLLIKNKSDDSIQQHAFDIIIGADGPRSTVAKVFFPKNRLECYLGTQATIKGDFLEPCYHAYLGDAFPEFFGWVVPESKKHARIGLATKKKPRTYFDAFCAQLGYDKKDIVAHQGGLIPVFNPRNTWYAKKQGIHAFLLGDAAGQIKSTTGGGIIPSLRCATFLARCIGQGHYSHYTTSPLLRHNRELYMHLIVRKMLDCFSDDDYDRLVAMCSRRSARRIFSRVSRDNSVRLAMRLFFAHPSFIRFLGKGMRGLLRAFWKK